MQEGGVRGLPRANRATEVQWHGVRWRMDARGGVRGAEPLTATRRSAVFERRAHRVVLGHSIVELAARHACNRVHESLQPPYVRSLA